METTTLKVEFNSGALAVYALALDVHGTPINPLYVRVLQHFPEDDTLRIETIGAYKVRKRVPSKFVSVLPGAVLK